MKGFFGESLSSEERVSLGLALYGANASYGQPGLRQWEAEWYARDLPPPPGRVLVGGAGSGREVVALQALGYEVAGFEPVASFFAAARASLPKGTRFWRMGYEDLFDDRSPEGPDSSAPYDAVIFGWGSISHVLDREMRGRVIEALHNLALEGPLLLSFFSVPRSGPAPETRVEALARRLGRRVGAWRGLPPQDSSQELFLPHAGFVHRFTDEELQALAASVGRVVRWGDDLRAYPHCSFVLP